jgi:hypothetical protein
MSVHPDLLSYVNFLDDEVERYKFMYSLTSQVLVGMSRLPGQEKINNLKFRCSSQKTISVRRITQITK